VEDEYGDESIEEDETGLEDWVTGVDFLKE
jgi:hypothetical protein